MTIVLNGHVHPDRRVARVYPVRCSIRNAWDAVKDLTVEQVAAAYVDKVKTLRAEE